MKFKIDFYLKPKMFNVSKTIIVCLFWYTYLHFEMLKIKYRDAIRYICIPYLFDRLYQSGNSDVYPHSFSRVAVGT
jgi:hypothetical protein